MSLLPALEQLGVDQGLLKTVFPSKMSGDSLFRIPSQNFGTIKSYKDKFQINLDVHHFNPEDITVKTSEGYVIIEGRDQHGWVTRQFCRRYPLPEGCREEAVQSRLSSDGVLTVVAPLEAVESNERVVPIVHTGPVRKDGHEK